MFAGKHNVGTLQSYWTLHDVFGKTQRWGINDREGFMSGILLQSRTFFTETSGVVRFHDYLKLRLDSETENPQIMLPASLNSIQLKARVEQLNHKMIVRSSEHKEAFDNTK